MRARFEGFTSGRLYAFDGIVPPNRGEFLRFEIGLLLSMLSENLVSSAHAEAYWHQIVQPLVREYIPAVTEEGMTNLTVSARLYRDKWLAHCPDEGPLGEVLSVAVLVAFDCDDNDDVRRGQIMKHAAGKTLDDCFAFVDRYSEIIKGEQDRTTSP